MIGVLINGENLGRGHEDEGEDFGSLFNWSHMQLFLRTRLVARAVYERFNTLLTGWNGISLQRIAIGAFVVILEE
jgi:hypothetical protein